jgi:hypothetical protein
MQCLVVDVAVLVVVLCRPELLAQRFEKSWLVCCSTAAVSGTVI